MGPKSLTDLFNYKGEMANYDIRNISSTLCLPQPRTNNLTKSFMCDASFLWNYIPKEIKESKSPSSPRSRTKIAAHFDT